LTIASKRMDDGGTADVIMNSGGGTNTPGEK